MLIFLISQIEKYKAYSLAQENEDKTMYKIILYGRCSKHIILCVCTIHSSEDQKNLALHP